MRVVLSELAHFSERNVVCSFLSGRQDASPQGMVLIGDYACEGSQCYFGTKSINGIPGASEHRYCRRGLETEAASFVPQQTVSIVVYNTFPLNCMDSPL